MSVMYELFVPHFIAVLNASLHQVLMDNKGYLYFKSPSSTYFNLWITILALKETTIVQLDCVHTL